MARWVSCHSVSRSRHVARRSSEQPIGSTAGKGLRRRIAAALSVASLALFALAPGLWAGQAVSTMSASAARQIQALQAEKAARTPAQLKMDSQLVYAVKLQRSDATLAAVPGLRPGVEVSSAGMTLVDITTTLNADLKGFLTSIGGSVVNQLDRSTRAVVPVSRIEEIAARVDVRWVMPAAKYMVNTRPLSEGDATHRANWARTASGFTGSGVRVGVLSDSDDFLATLQGSGDLPATIAAATAGPGFTEVTGQGGHTATSTGEGSGMMEIVYDLAPNVHLFFATADPTLQQFATNITTLAGPPYNCDIIVDDVTYFVETPFHEGDSGAHSTTHAADVIQAVNTVVAGGKLYFSSAANDQNEDQGQSGTWEGNWADGGVAPPAIGGTNHVLDFGGGQTYDNVTYQGCGAGGTHSCVLLNLWWADPLGGSSNDYDLYLLSSTGGSVVAS
jgi:hypothetical protein